MGNRKIEFNDFDKTNAFIQINEEYMTENEIDFTEYGIALTSENRSACDGRGGEIHTAHRTGMSKEDAKKWIQEWEEGGGRKGSCVVISRPVGKWKIEE